MFTKKVITLVLMIALAFSLFGCKAVDVMKGLVSDEGSQDIEIVRSGDEGTEVTADANLRDTVLYYQNENGYLVPVKRKIPWETGIAKAALRSMIDSPAVREDISAIGLEPVIPTGAEILGMSISEEGLCKVNFNSQVLNYQSQKEEENLVKGVVYTLTEFPTISEVQLMVDGQSLAQLEYGTQIGSALKREDINSMASNDSEDPNIVVFYKGTSNGEYEYYVPVTVPVATSESEMYTAVDKLFEGPPVDSGLYTDIPDGVYLQDVVFSEGLVFVDLIVDNVDVISQQITFDRMAKNIGLTLSQFDSVESVDLLIGGQTVEEAGINIAEPDTMPVFANEY
ncbi:GerMN domain-containing protein [Sporosalibacterium faouarense]|uniref:GerMN domain-containing protein n=1 Tax=Sporosalibacterium faouarense TaxID=516123 RepID=UPI00141CF6F6|nr:GerMN domain-containing protein [Sporosalibacterium faouarense]MTI46691.1 spore gernimation protein GerM [Bacillota bacterium]